MAEQYPANNGYGNDALANGMVVLDGTEDRRNGWQAINRTRDYIVQRVAGTRAWAEQQFAQVNVTLGTKLTRTTEQYNADIAFRDNQIAALNDRVTALERK